MEILQVKQGTPEFSFFSEPPIKGDQFYQPKSSEEILFELSADREFFQHGFGQAFVCRRGNISLGRIYASVDKLLPESLKIGIFGYFDTVDDNEVAQLLLTAAENWLKEQGCSEMHGPINLNIYNGYRLQTKGFSTEPFLGEPRSPEYFKKLIEKSGFSKSASWNSWDFSILWLPIFWIAVELKILKMCFTKKKNLDIKFKAVAFNQNSIEKEFEKLYPLIMDSFKKNYLFTHVDLKEYKTYFLGLSKLLDPASSIIVNEKNEAIGFTFTFANILGNSTAEKALVLHTICISEEYRKGGLVYLLSQHTNRKVFGRYSRFIGALAKEGKTTYDKIGTPSRSYAVYKKIIKN